MKYMVGLCVFFIGMLLLMMIDGAGIDTEQVSTFQVSREYTAAHSTTTFNNNMPQTIQHPESFLIRVIVDNVSVGCIVSESQYNNFVVDGSVTAFVGIGRITSTIYCKGLM